MRLSLYVLHTAITVERDQYTEDGKKREEGKEGEEVGRAEERR
jgi:hypothetical protein